MLEHNLSFADLQLTPSEIYEQMGYRGGVPDMSVVTVMVATLREIRTALSPKFCFLMADGQLDVEQSTLTVTSIERTNAAYCPCGCAGPKALRLPLEEAVTFNIGKIIARQLRGSEAFAFFVATAGVEFEALLERWKGENDMVRLYIADAIGSLIAEKAADHMEMALQQTVDERQWRHTNRFSPGYCGWHVSQQQRLFPLFGTDRPCGVRLTESSLMMPIKSVSGVVGLGCKVKKLDYSCGLCDYGNCYKRKYQKQKA